MNESKFFVLAQDVTVPDPDGNLWSPPAKSGEPATITKGTRFEMFPDGQLIVYDFGPMPDDEQSELIRPNLDLAESRIGQWVGFQFEEIMAALAELGIVTKADIDKAKRFLDEISEDREAVNRMMYKHWISLRP